MKRWRNGEKGKAEEAMDRGNSPVNRGELDTAISRHLNFLYDDGDRRTNFSRKEVHP